MKAADRDQETSPTRQSTSGYERPLLSVIMPVYNVEEFLREAINSVLNQSWHSLELILIDDGSSDSSGAICDEYAAKDARVRVLHKSNGGLGAARNSGIAMARGQYLAFIDSDDIVFQGSYALMIKTLELTGSDFVTGNVLKGTTAKKSQSWLHGYSHATPRINANLTEFPELLYDTVAWNKVFVREFFEREVGGFPVGKYYEDTVPMAKAYIAAKSVDVLTEHVYLWRVRDSGDSITQQPTKPSNFADRVEMLDQISSMVVQHSAAARLRDILETKILEGDLWIHIRALQADSPRETFELAANAVDSYYRTASPARRRSMWAYRKVTYELIHERRFAEAVAFLNWGSGAEQVLPGTERNGSVYLDDSRCPVDISGLSEESLDIAREARGVSRIVSIGIDESGILNLVGIGFIRRLPNAVDEVTLVATSVDGQERRFETKQADTAQYSLKFSTRFEDRCGDGFTAAVPLADLSDAKSWSFSIEMRVGEFRTDSKLDRGVLKTTLTGLSPVEVGDGQWCRWQVDSGKVTGLLFWKPKVNATIYRDEGAFGVASDDPQALIGIDGSKTGLQKIGEPTALLNLSDVGETRKNWSSKLTATTADGTVVRVVGRPDTDVVYPSGSGSNGHMVRVVAEPNGALLAQGIRNLAFLERVQLTAEGIEIEGTANFSDSTLEFGIAVTGGVPHTWEPATLVDGRFKGRITWAEPRPLSDNTNRKPGTYFLKIRTADGEALRIVTSRKASGTLPSVAHRQVGQVLVSRTRKGGLRIDLDPPRDLSATGSYRQRALLDEFGRKDRSFDDAVFFVVDAGVGSGDSAKAIANSLRKRHPGLALKWGISDWSVDVPEGTEAVLKFSREWYRAANLSRFVVNNYGALHGAVPHPDQHVLQTWHGTPLKFIGAQEPSSKRDGAAGLSRLSREAAEWSAFVSPSPYMTRIARRDFLFEGNVLETGLPRNDRLRHIDEVERATIRTKLGISPEDKVVLYAPTYRSKVNARATASRASELNVNELAGLLGPGWQILYRSHGYVSSFGVDRSQTARVVDVSLAPDVNDLYIAADILITDYSSVMFDFAVTQKPVVFHVADFESYVKDRGVYFDIELMAPGPVVDSTLAAHHALTELGRGNDEWVQARTTFSGVFSPFDDGQAADRVVTEFFDPYFG